MNPANKRQRQDNDSQLTQPDQKYRPEIRHSTCLFGSRIYSDLAIQVGNFVKSSIEKAEVMTRNLDPALGSAQIEVWNQCDKNSV